MTGQSCDSLLSYNVPIWTTYQLNELCCHPSLGRELSRFRSNSLITCVPEIIASFASG